MKHLALSLACLLGAPALAEDTAVSPCQQVLGWLNDGSLASRLRPLDQQPSASEKQLWQQLNPERARLYDLRSSLNVSLHGTGIRIGEVIGGGTCNTWQIEAIGRHNPDSYPDTADEELRWSTWGTRDYLLELEEEPLIISGRLDSEHSQVSLVSRLADDGSKQPLCLFEHQPQTRQEEPEGEQAQLCRAVLDGQAEALEWQESRRLGDPQRHSRLAHIETTPSPIMALDIDGDGREERLARHDHESGAGCGSRSQHLLLVDANDQVLPREGLNAELLERQWGPLGAAGGRNLGIFRLEGRTYLLASRSWRDEVFGLYDLEHPGEELCRWRERPQYRLSRQF